MKTLGIAACLTLLIYTPFSSSSGTSMEDVFATLNESESISESTVLGVDANDLFLSQDALVTVYFVGEGAGYKNSFGWYDAATDPTLAENRNLIWGNASGSGDGLSGGGSLDVGDSSSLGTISAGTQIGFYLTANGYNYPNNPTYYSDVNYNGDGIEHVIAGVTGADGLLALGFEDLWGGGDEDYNDLMIAVDIGFENVAQIVAAAPEPELWLLLLLGILFAMKDRVSPWFARAF